MTSRPTGHCVSSMRPYTSKGTVYPFQGHSWVYLTFSCIIIFECVLLSHFSRVRLCNTIDGSLSGSPVLGILQARITGVGCHFLLQCMKVKVKSVSRVQPSVTPWTAAFQAPPSMGFSRKEYWSGVPFECVSNIYKVRTNFAK